MTLKLKIIEANTVYKSIKRVFDLPLTRYYLGLANFCLRFEMSGNFKEYQEGFDRAILRSQEIFKVAFKDSKKIWIVLHFYTKKLMNGDHPKELEKLIKFGYKIENSEVYEHKQIMVDKTDDVYLNSYSIEKEVDIKKIKPILHAIIAADLGIDPKIFLGAYFFDTERGILFSLYDDRGLDLVATKKELLLPIYKKYNEWIINADLNPKIS